MKVINKACQILAIVFGAAALFLFFTSFATITTASGEYAVAGSILAFAGKFTAAGVKMATSSKILFCFLLSLLSVACGALTFKSKGARYFAPAFALGAAIFMLVITLSNPVAYIDVRPLEAVAVSYTASVLLATVALFACFAFGTAHLLLDDYIIVSGSKDKLTIPKKVVRFLRDYKSETKKIVWPGFHEVVKNTIVVLIMCLIVGGFIWIVDFGLGELLQWLLKIS